MSYYVCSTAQEIPAGYRVVAVTGFVKARVLAHDPEHQWIEKLRSMRASNEARQLTFAKTTCTLPNKKTVFNLQTLFTYLLLGKIQRRIANDAFAFGANAVIG